MPSSNQLRDTIATLAATFATEVTQAIRASNLQDILALAEPKGIPVTQWLDTVEKDLASRPKKTAPARKQAKKRTKVDPGPTAIELPSWREAVLSYLRGQPGISGQEARKANGMSPEQWGRTIGSLLETGAVRKEGIKNKTRYWAV